jgi:hypothetical protein
VEHAEAHELIADLAVEAGALDRLAVSARSTDVALRRHIEGCPRCRAAIGSWQRLQAATSDALAGTSAADVARIAAPADLRRRVMVEPEQGHSWTFRRLRVSRWALAGAAALVLALAAAGGAALLGERADRLATAEHNVAALTKALATSDRVLADPERHVLALQTTAGGARGTLAWTRHDLVVMATGLAPPAGDRVYRCWTESNGAEAPVGRMNYVSGQAFWSGSLDGWASIDLGPGSRFLVSLEEKTADAAGRSGPVVLEGRIGG